MARKFNFFTDIPSLSEEEMDVSAKYIAGKVFTNSNVFNRCKTKEELKKIFKKLAKEAHPDKGGDVRSMQNINDFYQAALSRLKAGILVTGTKPKFKDTFGW